MTNSWSAFGNSSNGTSISISFRAQARSKSFCDSPNSAPRKTRTTPCLMLRPRFGIALFRSIAMVRPKPRDCDAILNNLHTRSKPVELWIDVDAYDLVVDPDAQITLLLEEIEELPRVSFRRNGNPESDENSFPRAVVQHLVTN